MSIVQNYRNTVQDIYRAGEKHSPSGPPTRLVVVTKTHDAATIRPLLEEGHRLFGENRVQEAQGKWPELMERYEGIELHLIGPLQTNKVKEAVALFHGIQTLDRPKLAHALAKERDKTGCCPELLIQVNTGEEPQKAGILPQEAGDFIRLCRDELQLPVKGLMCIPPVEEPAALHFALLKKLAQEHNLPELSMGMSGDYVLAAEMGATYVRVGTAIFGER